MSSQEHIINGGIAQQNAAAVHSIGGGCRLQLKGEGTCAIVSLCPERADSFISRFQGLSRSWRTLAFWVLLPVHLAGQNTRPVFDNLQFWSNGALIQTKLVVTGHSYGWGSVDLGTVPETPLPSKAPPNGWSLLNLWYQSPSLNTEVDLFALDPTPLAEAMTNILPALEIVNASDQPWIQAVEQLQYNPPAAAIPFPGPNFVFGPPPPITVPLSTSLFLPPNLQPLHGAASLPNGNGSVKAVRIYDHGSCSVFQPTTSVYQEMVETFDAKYACDVSKGADAGFIHFGATPTRTYSHLATRLKHQHDDPAALSDGFIFDGDYGAGSGSDCRPQNLFQSKLLFFCEFILRPGETPSGTDDAQCHRSQGGQ